MKQWIAATGFLVGLNALGCGDDHQRPELRAALDAADLTLIESVDTALTVTNSDRALTATIVPDAAPSFSVATSRARVQLDGVTGALMAMQPGGASVPSCEGQIPLAEALAIAETEADGDAVASVPDDDVACAFEIQILHGETLWEVKLSSSGAVLEKELSDEFGGDEED